MNKKILLDTHVWVWLVGGIDKLPKDSLALIEEAAECKNLFVSAISTWEVAVLHYKNKLSFSIPIEDWMDLALMRSGIKVVPLTPSIAIESYQLPGDFHGDPADRIIVATAKTMNYSLVTRDEKIISYADNGIIDCLS